MSYPQNGGGDSNPGGYPSGQPGNIPSQGQSNPYPPAPVEFQGQPGYGQQYGGQVNYGAPGVLPGSPIRATEAITKAWGVIFQNPGPWIGAAAIYLVGSLILNFIPVLGQVAGAAVGLIMAAQMYRNAWAVSEGHQVTLASFFDFDRIGSFILANLLLGLTVFAGMILLVIPGLIAAFLGMFTLAAVAGGFTGFAAVKRSWKVSTDNFGQTFLLALIYFGLFLASLITLGIGSIVAVPVIAMTTVIAYRQASSIE